MSRPVPLLTPPLMRLAATLLRSASNAFANHGCNDIDLSTVPGLDTDHARVILDREYHAWNGDLEEHDPASVGAYGTDFALMSFLAAILDNAAKEPIATSR